VLKKSKSNNTIGANTCQHIVFQTQLRTELLPGPHKNKDF